MLGKPYKMSCVDARFSNVSDACFGEHACQYIVKSVIINKSVGRRLKMHLQRLNNVLTIQTKKYLYILLNYQQLFNNKKYYRDKKKQYFYLKVFILNLN